MSVVAETDGLGDGEEGAHPGHPQEGGPGQPLKDSTPNAEVVSNPYVPGAAGDEEARVRRGPVERVRREGGGGGDREAGRRQGAPGGEPPPGRGGYMLVMTRIVIYH